MTYVLSDIHGNMENFKSILKQIDLQPDDTLYILGDDFAAVQTASLRYGERMDAIDPGACAGISAVRRGGSR